MSMYLSYHSAASCWGIPQMESVLGAELFNNSRNQQVQEITVTHRNVDYRQKNRITHVCQLPLPRDAVVKIGADLVASPELVFLQFAGRLDIHRLILLGLQMCSHAPANHWEAVTTKRKLANFLDKTKGYRGHEKAMRALQYVQNGSGSILESVVYMIMTLPYSYGGFGLGGAEFNYEILLNLKSRRILKQNRCFADLYYKESRLAVEYDSFKHHSTPAAQSKDLTRITALQSQGIEVMRLGTMQLYDYHTCEEFAYNLSKRLGKRIKAKYSRGFREAQRELRKLLLTIDIRPD